MNFDIFVLIVVAFTGSMIAIVVKKYRHAFLVSEGYAGLLYHQDKFVEVLKSKQEGQAALERARGESAALRNLANAAKLLEGNPALMNLRLMQSLSAAQNAGNTPLLGMPGGFVPLKNGKSTPVSEPSAEC